MDNFAAAQRLEQDEPELVRRVADELRVAADEDHRRGAPRGKAYVRRLQELAIDHPELAIAVGRALGLEHIVTDLLDGVSVEGVAGIGSDGAAQRPTRRHQARRRGIVIIALSALILLVEAVTADALSSPVLYVSTAIGLSLFFVGCYLVTLRE